MSTRKRRRKMTKKQAGALGGAAACGKAKARPSNVARAAALARWARIRAQQPPAQTEACP